MWGRWGWGFPWWGGLGFGFPWWGWRRWWWQIIRQCVHLLILSFSQFFNIDFRLKNSIERRVAASFLTATLFSTYTESISFEQHIGWYKCNQAAAGACGLAPAKFSLFENEPQEIVWNFSETLLTVMRRDSSQLFRYFLTAKTYIGPQVRGPLNNYFVVEFRR